MYIYQLHLRDIIWFENQTIDFTQQDANQHAPWTVILGNNGTGKSNILQMLSLCLLGRDMIHEVAQNTDWPQYVRKSARKGRIELVMQATDGDKKGLNGQFYVTTLELGSHIRTGLKHIVENKDNQTLLNDTLYGEELTSGWFSCAYGPFRRLAPQNYSIHSSVISNRKPYRFATMFDNDRALSSVQDWLVRLEFQKLKDPKDENAKKVFDLAIKALEIVLEGVEFKGITAKGEVLFNEKGYDIPLERLSEGYKTTTAWIIDLVQRLVEAFPKKKNPLKSRGVVLVDEIDAHLHPQWQRRIVEQIRMLFPNLQFIVSTHSPFIAQDMRPDDKIIVLEKEENLISVIEHQGFVSNWRVDQILTSGLFNLNTTRNTDIEMLNDEHTNLLNKRFRGQLSDKETKRLEELDEILNSSLLPPGETDYENELFKSTRSIIELLDDKLTD